MPRLAFGGALAAALAAALWTAHAPDDAALSLLLVAGALVVAAAAWLETGTASAKELAVIAALGIVYRGFPRPFAWGLGVYVTLKLLERWGFSIVPLYPWGTIALYASFGVTLLLSLPRVAALPNDRA